MSQVTTKVVSVNQDGTVTPRRNRKRERMDTLYNFMQAAWRENRWVTREQMAECINSTVGSINVSMSSIRRDDDTVVIERSKDGYRMRVKAEVPPAN